MVNIAWLLREPFCNWKVKVQRRTLTLNMQQGHNSHLPQWSDISRETTCMFIKKHFCLTVFFALECKSRHPYFSHYHYPLFHRQILFHGQVSARSVRCTVFSTNLTPIFVYFTELSWLIATFFTVTACSKGGCVSWTIRSIWIRSVVLLKYVKGFPSLCCGYFKTRSTLGYESH